ncbi:hypothetical protein [Nocardiopsis rhodophaea]|uniref:hypothetical protein n=1 Tax=Nocardiopsis rhodophaea TaxID=280238 RepID=UPI0031D37193
MPAIGPEASKGAAAMERLGDLAHEAFHRASWRVVARATNTEARANRGGDTGVVQAMTEPGIARQLPPGHLGEVFTGTRDRAEHLGYWLACYRTDDGWRFTPTDRGSGNKRTYPYLAQVQAHPNRSEREGCGRAALATRFLQLPPAWNSRTWSSRRSKSRGTDMIPTAQ